MKKTDVFKKHRFLVAAMVTTILIGIGGGIIAPYYLNKMEKEAQEAAGLPGLVGDKLTIDSSDPTQKQYVLIILVQLHDHSQYAERVAITQKAYDQAKIGDTWHPAKEESHPSGNGNDDPTRRTNSPSPGS